MLSKIGFFIGNTLNNGAGGGGSSPQLFVSETGSGSGAGTIGDPLTGQQLKDLIDAGLPGVASGTTIKFNKGETYRYQYDVDNSNINFDAYGTGAAPIISGDTDLSGATWTNDSGNIYYTSLATEPKWVFVNDQSVKMAETAWITIKGRSTQLKIEALASVLDPLHAVETLVGAYLLAKEWDFRPCLRVGVTAYTTGAPNGSLTLDAIPNTDTTGAGVNMPFKLLNKKSFITEVGEWSYDAVADRLYIMTAGGAPSNVKISTRDYGIKIGNGLSGISINGIKFQHQFLEGVYSVNNSTISVTNCTFSDIRTNGASFTGNGTNITFNTNTLLRIGNNALHVGGINTMSIQNNDFDDIGIQDGPSIPQYSYFKSVGCGVHMRWDDTATVYVPQNLTVQYNTFDNMGYCGIVNVGISHTVRFNKVNTYCVKWNDGAGIYTSNVYGEIYGHGSDTRDGVVSDNIVLGGLGSALTTEGTLVNRFIMGLYLDNNCSAITLERNHIEDVWTYCLLSNWSSKNFTIRYNNFINGLNYGVGFRKWAGAPSTTGKWPNSSGHIFTNNIIACRDANSMDLLVESIDNASYNPFTDGGSSDNNGYYNPYKGNLITTRFATNTDMTLASWKAVFSTDSSSVTDITKRYRPSDAQSLVDILSGYNYTASPTTLSTTGHYYLNGTTNANSVDPSIPAYNGVVVIRDYAPEGSLVVDDTYTGSTVTLASHTPDTGVAWTILTGAHAIDGSGALTSSTAGYISQTTAGKNATIETTARVTATGSFSIHSRYVGTSDRILVQVSTSGNAVTIINDGTTLASGTAGKTISTNTDYTIKVRVVDGNVTVWVDGTARLELFNNATIAASNTGAFVHGIFNPLVGQHTRTRIWNQ